MRFIKFMPLALIFLPVLVFAQDERLSREAEFEKLTNTEDYFVNSPFVTADSIIFFYKGKANMILVAGDFNDWKPELLMRETETNFWQYSWGVRLPKGTYKYKLVVDDVWINDPGNTNIINDDSGQAVSYFDLKEDFIPGQPTLYGLKRTYISSNMKALRQGASRWSGISITGILT